MGTSQSINCSIYLIDIRYLISNISNIFNMLISSMLFLPISRCSVQQSNLQFLKSGTLIFVFSGLMLAEVIKNDWPSTDLQTGLGWSEALETGSGYYRSNCGLDWPLAKLDESSAHNWDWLSGLSLVWLPARPGHSYCGNDGGQFWLPGARAAFEGNSCWQGHPLGWDKASP